MSISDEATERPTLRGFPDQIAYISDEDLADAASLREIIKAKIDAWVNP